MPRLKLKKVLIAYIKRHARNHCLATQVGSSTMLYLFCTTTQGSDCTCIALILSVCQRIGFNLD